jgi:hypothetical protein
MISSGPVTWRMQCPTKFPSKLFLPQRNKDKNPFQKEWSGKHKMDEETRRELRRKKLCFSCKEPWELGHRCMGNGKVHFVYRYFQIVMGKRRQDELREMSMSACIMSICVWRIRMLSSHVWRLRVGLLPLYQVFLDFTLSGSVEYYKDNVSQYWLKMGKPTISFTHIWQPRGEFLQKTLRVLVLWYLMGMV